MIKFIWGYSLGGVTAASAVGYFVDHQGAAGVVFIAAMLVSFGAVALMSNVPYPKAWGGEG